MIVDVIVRWAMLIWVSMSATVTVAVLVMVRSESLLLLLPEVVALAGALSLVTLSSSVVG